MAGPAVKTVGKPDDAGAFIGTAGVLGCGSQWNPSALDKYQMPNGCMAMGCMVTVSAPVGVPRGGLEHAPLTHAWYR